MRKITLVLFIALFSNCPVVAQMKSQRTDGRSAPQSKRLAQPKLSKTSNAIAFDGEAERILRKFTEAMGEPRAQHVVRSYVKRGVAEVSMYNLHGTIEEYMKRPNKRLLVINMPGRIGQLIQGRDARGGWAQTRLSGYYEMGNESSDSTDDLSEEGQNKNLKNLFSKLKYVGKAEVNGREALVVAATLLGGKAQVLYFDAQTGLMLRIDNVARGEKEKNLPRSIFFEGFAKVEGLVVPAVIQEVHDDYTFTVRFYEVKFNVAIEDSLFERPKGPDSDNAEVLKSSNQ